MSTHYFVLTAIMVTVWLPIIVYLCFRMATVGYLRGKKSFDRDSQEPRSK